MKPRLGKRMHVLPVWAVNALWLSHTCAMSWAGSVFLRAWGCPRALAWAIATPVSMFTIGVLLYAPIWGRQ